MIRHAMLSLLCCLAATAQPLQWPDRTVSVRIFGAVGDGVTDDTVAIQNALDALSPGDTLKFPAGEYVVQGGLTLTTPRVRLIGTGGGGAATLHNVAPNTATLTITGSPGEAVEQRQADGGWYRISSEQAYFDVPGRAYVKGELVRGDAATVLDYTKPTIQPVNWLDGVRIEGLSFTGLESEDGQLGLRLAFCRDARVRDCGFADLRSGMALATCLHSRVESSRFADIDAPGTGYGVQVLDASQHIAVTGNHFERCRHGFTTAGHDGVCMYLTVTANHASDCTNAALNTHGNARFVTIADNMVSGSQMGVSTYSPHTRIAGNTIIDSEKSAIYATEAGPVNLTVTDNTIARCSRAFFGAIVAQRTATDSEPNRFVRIAGNTVDDAPNGPGVKVDDATARRVVVSDNTLSRIGYSGAFVKGAKRVIVRGNTLDGMVRKDQVPWRVEEFDVSTLDNNVTYTD